MVPMGERALTSRKRVNLIDMKRGQNAGIALARIKMSFAEVKERISLMDDEIFTTDQLRSLSVSIYLFPVRAHFFMFSLYHFTLFLPLLFSLFFSLDSSIFVPLPFFSPPFFS